MHSPDLRSDPEREKSEPEHMSTGVGRLGRAMREIWLLEEDLKSASRYFTGGRAVQYRPPRLVKLGPIRVVRYFFDLIH